MSEVDRIACAPPERLARYGVTRDNHDLLRPGPGVVEQYNRLMTQLRAQQLLRAGGGMTPGQFRDALVEAFQMLGGES